MKNKIHAVVINIYFAFTLLIYAPYEIFFLNQRDFEFGFAHFWWIPFITGIIYIVSSSIFILAIQNQNIQEWILIFIFQFTTCCYIQAMFLNGYMKVLVGDSVTWNEKVIYLNLLIWLAIFITSYILKKCIKNFIKIAVFLAISLCIMQLTNLFFLILTNNRTDRNGYVTSNEMLTLSTEENVIVFILDYFDGRTMDKLLADYPDMLDNFDGFTYFPNATSMHSRTYPSITYLLTGEKCFFDKEPEVYIDEAFDKSNFIRKLNNDNISIGLYTYADYLGSYARSIMCNYTYQDVKLNFLQTEKNMIKIMLYRELPYILKGRFYYYMDSINNESIAFVEGSDLANDKYRFFDDDWFKEQLDINGLKAEGFKGAFRFYHLSGCHRDLTQKEKGGYLNFQIVKDYCDKLKEIGLYDQSTIIIATDHGFSGGGDTLDMPHETAVPLVMVKMTDSNGVVKVSDAPVSQTEFIPTVLEAYDLRDTADGRTFGEIDSNEVRDRFYYYTALNTDEDGEIELREYCVKGDAKEKASYHFTGNTWPVHYSMNKVKE